MTALDLPTIPAWFNDAACAQVGGDSWFPTHETPDGERNAARATCAACPVRRECLTYALTNREAHGIWGGTTDRQRRRMRGAA